MSVSFKTDRYTYQETEGQAVVEIILTGRTEVDVVVLVMGGTF